MNTRSEPPMRTAAAHGKKPMASRRFSLWLKGIITQTLMISEQTEAMDTAEGISVMI